MRVLGLSILFVSLGLGCDDPAPNESLPAVESEVTAEPREPLSPTAQPSAKPIPKLPEERREDRPVEEMSDQELEVACFEGRREACDLLGH